MTREAWSDAEVRLLRAFKSDGLTIPEIAERMGRSANSVGGKLRRLHLQAPRGSPPRRPWPNCGTPRTSTWDFREGD